MTLLKRIFLHSSGITLLLVGVNTAAFAGVVQIGALVTGQVTQVAVKEGQSVTAGQLLIKIDDERFQANLKAAKATTEMARLNFEDAKIDLAQELDLFDRTVTAKRELDLAQLKHDVAQQTYKKAQAEQSSLQAWAKYYVVKAPVSGKVKSIQAPQGTTVFHENTPLIQLEN